jgi:hypothetical protein
MSVLPDRVAESLGGRAVTLATDDVRAALDELEWQRWIASDARGYAFVARIVKDIIAQDMLTPGQKRRILESAGITAP